MTDSVLADAAFGDHPGRWPLPAARSPREHWLRAVAAGGQGRYGSAIADLTTVWRSSAGPLRSLAFSTRASFLRQLGGHDHARGWDGRAWALVADRGEETGAETTDEAAADALIGLAADALGVGRFAASERLLQRAREIPATRLPPRVPVRLAWVSSELAMFRGDGGDAVAHAERAVATAAGLGSARHTLKSEVVLAASLCSAGHLDRSREVADAALTRAAELDMIPLRWALACLLADIGSSELATAEVTAIRDACADTVRDRGGVWSDR
jgi:hypothetical protein